MNTVPAIYMLLLQNGCSNITLVKDINPGITWSNPMDFTNINGTLFFVADDGIHGTELWKADFL